ncbi:MAG: stage sporulation protein [Clostridia bacterium]|jgi:stage V sporulation protein AC|nr:stage sporulation protein [Clostridia bacterium]
MPDSEDTKTRNEQFKQQLQQQKKQEYQNKVKQAIPKPYILKNGFWAFVVGGLICVIAQVLSIGFQSIGLVEKRANTAALVIMIFLGAFLTGLEVYDNIGKIAGVEKCNRRGK